MRGIASPAGRRPKALGNRRSGRAGEPAAGESVGASASLDDPSSTAAALPLRRVDAPHRPRLPFYRRIARPISMGQYQRPLVLLPTTSLAVHEPDAEFVAELPADLAVVGRSVAHLEHEGGGNVEEVGRLERGAAFGEVQDQAVLDAVGVVVDDLAGLQRPYATVLPAALFIAATRSEAAIGLVRARVLVAGLASSGRWSAVSMRSASSLLVNGLTR